MAVGLGYDVALFQRVESRKAPRHIGNFSDKQTQQVVELVGALGMYEWEGATIDCTTARAEAESGSRGCFSRDKPHFLRSRCINNR